MDSPIGCALCTSLGSIDVNNVPYTEEAKKNHVRIHFEQSKILDDEITEDEIAQRCFNNQPKTEHPAVSTAECRQSLLVLCKSFLKHRSKGAKVICNTCGCGITVRVANDMISHSCAHLGIKFFKCRHCDQSAAVRYNILHHIHKMHNIEATCEDFEDNIVEYSDEISNQIKRCFSTSYPRSYGRQREFVLKSSSRNKCQRSIVYLCRSIFLHRSKPSSVECNLCGSRINCLEGRSTLKARAMFQHASAHLDVKLFSCYHCDQSLSNTSAMRMHLKNTHQIVDGNEADFEDLSEKFHSVHLKMIERCFSADQVKSEGPSTKDKGIIRAETSVRCHTIGSKLTVERHLLCNKLIRMTADSDGKIKCSLCSKRLRVRNSANVLSEVAFSHVEMHLQKQLYRCKVCGSSLFSTRPAVRKHLKSKHALGMGKNYEYLADEFHEEIMDTFSKCFPAECS